jgi:hypothetical protein
MTSKPPPGVVVGQWDLLPHMPGFGTYWTVVTVQPPIDPTSQFTEMRQQRYHLYLVDADGHELGGTINTKPAATLADADQLAVRNLTGQAAA